MEAAEVWGQDAFGASSQSCDWPRPLLRCLEEVTSHALFAVLHLGRVQGLLKGALAGAVM